MSVDFTRLEGESDDAYFCRIVRAMQARKPELPIRKVYYAAYEATGLDCPHPFPFREYLVSNVESRAARHPEDYPVSMLAGMVGNGIVEQCGVCGSLDCGVPFNIRNHKAKTLAYILALVTARDDEDDE